MPMQRNALIVALAILTVLMANASAHAGTPMSDRVAVEAGVKAQVRKDLALPYNPGEALTERQ